MKKRTESKSFDKLYVIALLSFCTLGIWWSTLQLGYVNWDDVSYLTENQDIKNLNMKALLTQFYAGNYHPLTMLSLALDYKFFGLNPEAFHRSNVLLHTLNSVLVFYLLHILFRSLPLALGTALLFSLHPLHVESVAWVAARKDVLYSAFWLLSAICWIRFSTHNKKIYYYLALVFFIFSCLSKAMAVTLVPILFIIEYLQNKTWSKKFILQSIPFIAIALVCGIFAFYAQGDAVKLNTPYSILERISLAAYGFWFYPFKTLFPFELSAFYPYPQSLSLWMYSLPVLTLIALFAGIKFTRDTKLQFGLFAYLIIIFPVLQLIPVGEAWVADRYSYLASVGLFLIPVGFLLKITDNFTGLRKYIYIAGIIPLTGLAMLTLKRIKVWKNSITLYENVLSQYPQYSTGYVNYGNALRENGDWAGAEKAYWKAIVADDKNDLPWNNLGILYSYKNNLQRSIFYYQKAADRKPGFPVNDYNIATAWFNMGNLPKALEAVEKSLIADSLYPEALHLSGVIYQQLKQYPLSISRLEKAIQFKPYDQRMYSDLGNTYFFSGNTQAAVDWFQKSINLNPKANPEAYNNMAYVLFQQGKQKEALEMYKIAAKQGHAGARNYLQQLGISW